MDLKEILERNKKAHHRLGMITKELYDTLSDGHHTSLRMAQVNEMMNASFEMLKESDVLHSYVDEELKPAEVEEKAEPKKATKKAAAKKPAAKKPAAKKATAKKDVVEMEVDVEEDKPVAKKAPAKKTTAKKAAVAEEKPVAKKAPAKKPAAKKSTAKKTTKK